MKEITRFSVQHTEMWDQAQQTGGHQSQSQGLHPNYAQRVNTPPKSGSISSCSLIRLLSKEMRVLMGTWGKGWSRQDTPGGLAPQQPGGSENGG